jgi:DNA-binding LacI/PurR family transcriptional regulator
MAGIKDVANWAGVSIATVSNVINHTKTVSPELTARVYAAIEALDYAVNPVGRGLKSNRTRQIGVIVPSFSQVFFPAVLQGIHESAMQHGYSVSVFESNSNMATEKEHIRFLQHSWIDGIILASYANRENISDREYIRTLAKMGNDKKSIPVVTLENALDPALDAVIVDNCHAAETAVSHLLSLGHKKIAHIAAPLRLQIGQLRLSGYKKCLSGAGIPFSSRLVCEGDYSPRSGYLCAQNLLKQGEAFTALFAASDQMAIGAMRALLDAGLRIPKDIAVIGVDNNFPSTLVNPSLSSVDLPKHEMGRNAMELLIRRLDDPSAPIKTVTLDTRVIVRRSTDASGDDSWELTGW